MPPTTSHSIPDGHDRQESAEDRTSQDGDLTNYLDFISTLPVDNAIAQRFISATYLLARAMLVSTVFNSLRSMDIKWEDSAELTGDIMNLSRS